MAGCPSCLVGVYACRRCVELWLRYEEADCEVDRDTAWRAYVKHLEGEDGRGQDRTGDIASAPLP